MLLSNGRWEGRASRSERALTAQNLLSCHTRNWKDAMGFVPFDNVIKLEPVFVWNGQYVENVHHYLVDETPSVDTCESLAASYVAWWDANMKGVMSSEVTLTMLRATIMETETSPGIEYTTGLPIVATGATQGCPNNVTVAIRWLTGLRGRSYRGRTYHIGLQENQVEYSYVNAPTISGLTTIYGDLIALSTNVGPAIMCVASKYHNGAERAVGVATPVTNVQIDRYCDSQRRRLPGRGR